MKKNQTWDLDREIVMQEGWGNVKLGLYPI